jgi:arylsulfatase
MKASSIALSLGLLLGVMQGPNAIAQRQTTGVLGSPGATSTIIGKQLPPPNAKFGGVIKDGAQQSPLPLFADQPASY